MAEPSLTQVFGSGALQDVGSITIAKADLASVGLTASATNSAEALFTAIILKARGSLVAETLEANLDQSISIEEGFPSITTRGTTNYRRNQLTVNFDKLDSGSTIDPDDY